MQQSQSKAAFIKSNRRISLDCVTNRSTGAKVAPPEARQYSLRRLGSGGALYRLR